MRMAIVSILLVLLVGCSTMESATKAGFDMAWTAAEAVIAAKIPVLEGKVMAYAKEQADKALDAACQYAAEKTASAAEKAVLSAKEAYGIDVRQAADFEDLRRMIREENTNRESRGEEPLGTGSTFYLILALMGWQVGKSAMRVVKPEKVGKS